MESPDEKKRQTMLKAKMQSVMLFAESKLVATSDFDKVIPMCTSVIQHAVQKLYNEIQKENQKRDRYDSDTEKDP